MVRSPRTGSARSVVYFRSTRQVFTPRSLTLLFSWQPRSTETGLSESPRGKLFAGRPGGFRFAGRFPGIGYMYMGRAWQRHRAIIGHHNRRIQPAKSSDSGAQRIRTLDRSSQAASLCSSLRRPAHPALLFDCRQVVGLTRS
jgi:hypothetical protein